MTKYSNLVNAATPVSKPIPGREKEMVKNRGGGYSFAIDKWSILDRFLILGTESNTYYASAKEMTKENANVIVLCAKEDYQRTVDRIVEISRSGRSPRNNAAIFALALIATALQTEKPEARKAAFEAVNSVARTGSMFLSFQADLNNLGEGWNRTRRRMTGNWYLSKTPDDLAYQTMKYRNRSGWTHGDLIKQGNFGVAESTLSDDDMEKMGGLLGYLVHGDTEDRFVPELVDQFEAIKMVESEDEVIDMIHAYGFTWEFVPSKWLKSGEVWRALVPQLPYTATLRNLGRMTSNGCLDDSESRKIVVKRLTDPKAIKGARVHPISILMAKSVYEKGMGRRGQLRWEPKSIIGDAMEDAFYSAFDYIEPSGKRFLIGLDVSSSMGWSLSDDLGMTAAEAAAAMCMAIARSEKDYEIMGFSDDFVDMGFTARTSLKEVMHKTASMTFGATRCSLPIEWAMKKREKFDVIMILTDNETNRGYGNSELLKQYRELLGIDTKMIVAAMMPNAYSVADPMDPGQLDIIGLDSNMPSLVSQFAKGEF